MDIAVFCEGAADMDIRETADAGFRGNHRFQSSGIEYPLADLLEACSPVFFHDTRFPCVQQAHIHSYGCAGRIAVPVADRRYEMFRACVAAEHRPIVHQQNARSFPRGGNSGGAPCQTAADDEHISIVLADRPVCERLAQQRRPFGRIVRCKEGILGYKQGVDAGVSACFVNEDDPGIPAYVPIACFLPVPFGNAVCAEFCSGEPVDLYMEYPRVISGQPVPGTDPYCRIAFRQCENVSCRTDRPEHSVRDQVWGTHLIHKLRIDSPSALIVEIFRFQ